jgi:gliding motility-associated-like protein
MKKIVILLTLFLLFGTVKAQFGGGTGSSGDPYQISTADHLAAMATNVNAFPSISYKGVYFKMMNDISLSGYANWDPIGNGSKYFKGIFDGDNKKITGLTISSGLGFRGLFGAIVDGCIIKNVSIDNCTITGGSNTGGLAGSCRMNIREMAITITNCHVSGTIKGDKGVGGLIGGIQIFDGTGGDTYNVFISNCSSSVNVSSSYIGAYIGGLIGTIIGSSASKKPRMSNCFATGSVTATGSTAYAGGLLGWLYYASVANCYARGAVSATDISAHASGLIGLISNTTVLNCYSTGLVTGAGLGPQGLIGMQIGSTTTNSFWDTETSGKTVSIAGTGKTTAEMKTQATFTSWDFATVPVWHIIPSENGGYPHLAWQVFNPVAPAIQAQNIVFSNVSGTQMTIGWTNGNGAKRVVFVKGGASEIAIATAYTTYTASANWLSKGTQASPTGYYCVYNGDGNSVTLTGLTSGTPYTVRVFEYNGPAGSEKYLTTASTNNPNSLGNPPAQIEVTATLGTTGTGRYETLQAAFNAINAGTHKGAITVTINGSTTEKGTATLYQSGYTNAGSTSSYTSVNIYPTETGLTITGNMGTPLIDLNGATNVTIDGRVKQTGNANLSLINSSNGSIPGTSTIRFINGASNNTVKYSYIRGSALGTTSGNLLFGAASSVSGNSNNTIDHNNITNANDAASPVNAIYSLGSGNFQNSGNTISNNNVYDFLNHGVASFGINISNSSSAWTITGNSFYETASFVPTASVAYTVINISTTTGNGFTISNNNIGGSEASCAGTAWTKTAAFDNAYTAISINTITGEANSVQGNNIKNFTYSNTRAGFIGIITTGATVANIGTITGNTIGSSSGTNSILYTGGAGATTPYFQGIVNVSSQAATIKNNIIGSITVANSNPDRATSFYGILVTGLGNTNVSNNSIGSQVTQSSIYASSASNTIGQELIGICYIGESVNNTMTGNTIANMKNATTSSGVSVYGRISGISVTNGIYLIADNIIRDLTIGNANSSFPENSSVTGISVNSPSSGQSVTGNTIFNLSNSFPAYTGNVIGIICNGGSSSLSVSNNLIHSLSVTGAGSAIAGLYGIVLYAGSMLCSNNTIIIGGNTTTDLYGIYVNGNVASETNKLYYNTVHLSGTMASGAANKSYGLYSAANTGTRDFRNNILNNARSTTGGAGKHYAIYCLYSTTTNLTINYNNYYANGTGAMSGYFGSDKSTLDLWKAATGQDAGSLSVSPGFANAGGTTALDYLPSATMANVSIADITTDYTGTTRHIPSNMGAIEKPIPCINLTDGGEIGTAQTICTGGIPIQLTNNTTPAGDAGSTEYQWKSSTDNSVFTNITTGTFTSSTFSPGSLTATTWYKRLAKVTCASEWKESNVVKVSVAASPTISAQPIASTTVCVDGAVNLSVTAANGTAVYNYQWYSNSAAANTGGTIITGATASTYTAPSTTAGTKYYYVVAGSASPGCNSVSSTVATVVTIADPTISTQPAATSTLCLNGLLRLSVTAANGTGAYTYQWWSNTTASNTGGTLLTGETASAFTVPTTVAGTKYYYVVVGSAGVGCSNVSSSVATVNTGGSPAISVQPGGTSTVCLNAAFAAITVTATASETLSYQWYSNTTSSNSGGTSLGTVNGANTGSYTPQSGVEGTVYYYCIINNSCGSITSSVSGAMITNPATVISSQSTAAQTKCRNESFTPITVTAAGISLAYQWYSNATSGNTGGTSLESNNGANTNSYTPQATTAGTLYYYCVVTGTCGTATSTISGAFVTNSTTAITAQSTATQTACIKGSFTAITVTTTGTALIYQWYSNTSAGNTGGTSLGTGNGANTSSYTPQATTAGTLYYYCVVTGTCGNATSSVSGAFITNAVTVISSQSTLAQTKCVNVAFSPVTVTATGTELTYQWYSNTTANTTGGTSLASANGAQTNSFTPSSATAGTTYYYCIVTGACVTATSSVSGAFTVNPFPAAAGTITGTATVCQSQAAVSYNVSAITAATSYIWAYSGTGATISETTNSTTITFAANATSGNLTVKGTNACGDGTVSAYYSITVNASTVIGSQSTGTQTQCPGGSFTAISVNATGAGSLTYQWYSNTTANNSGGTSLGSANGAQTSSYTPQAGSTGTIYYYCEVTGSCGSATSAISGAFIVTSGTVIVSQSTATQIQCITGTFTPVTLTATGTGTLTYQWYKNTVASLTGATSLASANGAQTSSYTPQISSAGSFFYYCSVLGGCGSAVNSAFSGEFIVSALPSAPTSVSATAATICSGSSSLLNATSAGNTIEWYTASSGGSYLGTSASAANFTVYPGSTGTYYAGALSSGVSSGSQTFDYTGSIVNFTVPAGVTSLVITAKGAQGGSYSSGTGGNGASMAGTFSVTAGQVLSILVGQHPTGSGIYAGGGGGTFVALGASYTTATPLIVAGGGGGASTGTGGAGSTSTSGSGPAPGTSGNGAPGTLCGGGGGGFYTSGGADTKNTGANVCPGGSGFQQGGAGGILSGYQSGGFGGGASSNYLGMCNMLGGAGGGYSGGSGFNSISSQPAGYGGGSYNGGTSQSNSVSGTGGNGQVVISYSATVASCPSPRTSVTVTISTPPTGGSVAGTNSTIVYGNSTSTMTLTGNTGTVQKWQKSLDNSPWSDITNSATTCSEIPTSPGSWRYRAVVKESCEDGYSTPCTIQVTKKELTIGGSFTAASKDYNGNTTASIATNSLSLPLVGSDVVTLTAVAVFENIAVGTGKTVYLTGSSITGTDVDKYTLSLTGAPTATASITAIAPALGTFAAINKTYGDPAFVLVNPTSNSSGTFSYTSGNTGVATVSGNTITILNAGASTITATQAASDLIEGYAAATTSATLTVSKADQVVTLTIPTSAPLKDLVGSLAITATSSAELAVEITKSGTATATLGGTSGNYTLSGVSSTGTITFTATPAENGNYNAATAISKSFEVQKNNQAISFSESFAVSYTYSPTLTIDLSTAATAAISPVTYAVVSGPATITGNQLTVTGAGTLIIRASQAGNDSYNPAPDVNQNITISKATPVITFANISKVYSDAPFTLSATSAGTGVFTYTSSEVSVATTTKVSDVTTATITGVGTTTLTVAKAADANYNPATKDATLTVSKADQTITFNTPADKIAGYAGFNLAATSTSSLAVSFSSGNTSVASLSGTNSVTVTVGNAGTSTITAGQAGDSHYNAAPNVERTFTVLACTNPTNGGTIGTDQSDCAYFNPSAITSSALPSGHPTGATLEYQWQKSTTSSSTGFNNIIDATATTYDPATISQTTWYRRLARVSCQATWSGATASNVIAMTIAPTVGGMVTGSGSIYYSGSTGTMTLSDHSGLVLKWQSSPDGTIWTDIANTTTTCSATPASVGIWKYRAQVKNVHCSESKYSEPFSISVTPKPLTISGVSVVAKTYNGNTTATLTGTAVLIGVKSGETVTPGGTPVANFASRNVANGIAVAVTGYTISGTHAGNYTLTQPAGLTGNITALQLTPHVTADDRPYNGSTTAALSAKSVTGMIAGETVTLVAGEASFDTKNIGTGKTVTASTLTLGGADKDNYSLASGATATDLANITAVQLTPSITAVNKPYDGNTTATLSAQSVSGMVDSETDVMLIVGAANFDNKDKGTSKTVTATTLSLGGTKAGNYVLAENAAATTIANITLVELTPHITADSKTYDGNTTAILSWQTVTGMISGETDVTLVAGAADFDTRTIGTGKTVTATSLSLGGSKAGNYTLAAGATATATAAINAKLLTPVIIAGDRPYNGNTTATLNSQSVTGMIAGESDVTLVVGEASFDTRNIGTNKTVTATILSLGGAEKGNYVLSDAAAATDQADITVVQLTPQITAIDKPYDGNTSATLSSQSVNGVLSGETVTLVVGDASFVNADKGTGKTVTASSLSLGGTNAANYQLASSTATDLADISAIQLTPHITAVDKLYDGSTIAVLSEQTVTGMVTGHNSVLLLAGAVNFENKNIGVDKTVNATDLTIRGADASNYVLTSTTATDLATITSMEVTPHIAANNKPYNGLTAAALSGQYVTGQLVGETVTLTGDPANFDNKNIGTGKTVTAENLIIGGTDAGNYLLTATTVTCQADITAVQLTPHITASDKTYNGNTSATQSTQTVSGQLSGETVTLSVGSANFDTRNIGTGKTVTASDLSLGGSDAGNYQLASGATATATATISPIQLIPSITANDKLYDVSTAATLSSQTLSGKVYGETVNLIVGAADFDTKNAGINKTVTATSLTLSGSDAGNYMLASGATAVDNADIKAVNLTISGAAAQNKIYDGTKVAQITGATLEGVLSPDDVTLTNHTSGTFAQSGIGTNIAVTTLPMAITGADKDNYTLTQPAGLKAGITARSLTIGGSFVVNDRPYNGSAAAAIATNNLTLLTKVGSEAVTLNAVATFDTKMPGTGKLVSLTGSSITGDDKDNYMLSLTGAPTTTASIIALTPVIGSFPAINKTFGNPSFILIDPASDSPGSFSYTGSDETVATISGNSVTILKAGTSTITATQAADAGFSSATTSALLTVSKANQLLSLIVPTTAPLNTFTGTSLSITGSSSSQLDVTITKSGTATATLNGAPGSYTLSGVSATGTIVITATQEGNGNYNPATISEQFDVQKNNQNITFSGSFGLTYTFSPSLSIDLSSAASASSTLAVSYSVLSGKATISGHTLNVSGAGTIVIQASQSGDNNTNPAPSVNQNIVISKATPVITFADISKTYGEAPIALSATSASTGAFAFESNNSSVAITAKVSAVTSATLTGAGSATLTVNQVADDNYNGATASATLTVSKADQVITIDPLPASLTILDFETSPIQVEAVSTSGLPVTLTLDEASVASLSGSNKLSTKLLTGTVTVYANQNGNANYNAAPRVAKSITVNKTDQVITFESIATRNSNDLPFLLIATSTSPLEIFFTSSDPSVARIFQNEVTISGAGNTTITASQRGSSFYNPSSGVNQIFTVSPCRNPNYGGTIAGSQAGCVPFEPVAFASTAVPTGHSGTIEYKWMSSASGDLSDFYDIDESNSATYMPGMLTGTTWYKRLARVDCMSEWTDATESNVIEVIVYQVSSGGSIEGSSTVCSGINSADLTLSGETGSVIKWQMSTDDWTTATDVSNTSTTLIATNLTSTTKYRAVVQSGDCSAANSADVIITVDPVSVGGVVTGTGTVTYGNSTGNMTLSGNIGTVVKWQKTDETGLWEDITCSALTYSEIPSSAGIWKYRAQVRSGVCSESFSEALSITVLKANAPVTLAGLTATYNANTHNAIAATVPADMTVTFTYNGTNSLPVNAGTYTVVGNIVNKNYQGSATGSMVISKANAPVTLGNLTAIYDGSTHVATATTVPADMTVTFTYNGASALPVNAGTYTVVGTISHVNYQGTSTADLVIDKCSQSIISFDFIPEGLRMTEEHQLVATSSSGLPVTFESSDPKIATISGDIMLIAGDGTVTITAKQSGDNNWKSAADMDQLIVTLPSFDNISSLFTPNNDGINDNWHIPDLIQYGIAHVKVYNRYGVLVFESKSYDNEWDGSWHNLALPAASYYYIIDSSTRGIITGIVNILR